MTGSALATITVVSMSHYDRGDGRRNAYKNKSGKGSDLKDTFGLTALWQPDVGRPWIGIRSARVPLNAPLAPNVRS